MALKDYSPEKWVLKEHTKVKHEILRKYLSAWVPILGSWNHRICYFDCFAGRGGYDDGTVGSPLIAMEVATELNQYANEVVCCCIEKDENNYNNLEQIISQKADQFPNVKLELINDEFSNVATQILDEVGNKLAPSFFFIDPFGFKGVPFEIIKRIMAIPRTEIFINFMTRDISRFLSYENLDKIFCELFGTDKWKRIVDSKLKGQEKEFALRDLYIKQLHESANVKYTLPFRVCMSEKKQTVYYLIHATNHFRGIEKMKDVMYHQGSEGKFAYLGPEDYADNKQLKLFDTEILDLMDYLMNRFKGKRVTFDNIVQSTYMDTPCLEKHYREALKTLKKNDQVQVTPVTSKTDRGLRGNDLVKF